MSFMRIQNEARLAAERAFDRYVALLQQEKDWSPAEEAEMRGLMETLGKELPAMEADRRVIGRARDLQQTIDAGQNLDEPRSAAVRAVRAYDDETRELLRQRRAGYVALTQAVSELTERWIKADRAT